MRSGWSLPNDDPSKRRTEPLALASGQPHLLRLYEWSLGAAVRMEFGLKDRSGAGHSASSGPPATAGGSLSQSARHQNKALNRNGCGLSVPRRIEAKDQADLVEALEPRVRGHSKGVGFRMGRNYVPQS